jgi:hypothetical protein
MVVVLGWPAAHPTEALGVSLTLKREGLWNGRDVLAKLALRHNAPV